MVDKFFSTLDDGHNQLGIVDRVEADRGFVVLRGIEAGKNCDLVLTDVDGLVGTAQKKIVIHVAANPIFDAMTIDGDLTVTGGLNVAGVKTQINSVDLEVKDNKILLNKGETGAGVSLGLAGIEIDRGSKPRVGFIWEEAHDQWTFSQKNLGNIAAPISGTQVGDRNYNDARYAQQTLNLADLTDAAAARSNIDVYSKSESDARFFNHGPNGATEELFLDAHSIRFQKPTASGFDQFWYDADAKVFHFVSAGATDHSVGNSTLKAALFDGDATNALHLGNYVPSDYPRKAENATITGAWTISNDFAVAAGKKIDGRDLDVDGAVLDSINGAGDGLVVKTGNDTFTRRAITVGAGMTVANGNGIAGNPLIDVDDFTITLAGDASGSVTITDLMSATLNLEVVGFYDSAESDARYVNVTGDTMSGDLSFSVGRVVLTDGTEAQPALTFADSDNGLYLAGPNSIGLSTAGVQRIGVDETTTTVRTNLLVTGANTTVKSAVVNFDTPRIILNKLGTAGYGVAGLHIERGTQQDATWFFDENNEYWTPGAGYLAVTNAPNQDVHVANRGYNDTRYLRISNNLSDLTDPVSARVALGLRDMAIQSKANVDIQGGMINGVEIGYGLAGKAKFTDLAANGTIRLNGMKLPSVDGINGQVLTTDGTGNLFWNTPVVYSVTSTTGGNSLVTDGVGPAFVLKTIKAGTDVAIDATADDLTVRVTGLLHSVEEDTTPALGGNLDVNGFAIVTTEVDGDIALVPDGNGKVRLDGHFWPNTDGTAGQVLRTNGSGQLSWVGATGIVAEYTSANYTASDANISGHLYGIDQKFGAVDTALDAISDTVTTHTHADKLSLSGGTMTGIVTLAADPIGVLDAATKQYVDNASTKLRYAYIVENSVEQAAAESQPVSNIELIDGYHFSHGINGLFPSNPSDANAWLYLNPTKSLMGNYYATTTYTGLVSDVSYSNFIIQVDVSSPFQSNGHVAIVIAYATNGGQEYTLSAVRGLTGIGWALVYNFGQPSEWVVDQKIYWQSEPATWDVAGKIRLWVKRVGTVITAKASDFAVNNPAMTILTGSELTVDLNSDPRLAIFGTSSRYGYGSTQRDSMFVDAVFIDGENAIFNVTTNVTRVYDPSVGAWVQDDTRTPQSALGVGKFVFNKLSKKLWYVDTAECVRLSAGDPQKHVDSPTINPGAYSEYNCQVIFGDAMYDARRASVQVKVLDTNSSSPTYNMYINAESVCTIAANNAVVRIINEFSSVLTFHVIIQKA